MRRLNRLFTLIELLVVISIIAILASMLLPALNRARDRAKEGACLGNLKQLTMSLFYYADDFDGQLPPAAIDSSRSWALLVYQYGNSYELFACPSDGFPRSSPHQRTYSCNAVPDGWGTDAHPFGTFDASANPVHWGWKIEQIGASSTMGNDITGIALLGERPGDDVADTGDFTNTGNSRVEDWSYSTMNNDRTTTTLHNGKGFFSFADGHVGAVDYSEWLDQTAVGNIWAWAWGYH